MKKHLLYILVLLLPPVAMKAQEKTVIDFPLHKLTGKWKMLTRKGLMMEEWERKDSTSLIGKSYLFKSGDTLLLTRLQLKITDDKIVYTSQPPEENKATSFTLTSLKNNMYTFEDETNDHSRKIQYKFTGTDEMHKTIENAAIVKQTVFIYSRVKN